jgi:glycosyltransferase involved in cell wall biosynthesis
MFKRVAIFAFDFPYPPNRGGRADIWRRIEGFRELGCEVMLVSWRQSSGANPVSDSDLAAAKNVVSRVELYPTASGPREFLARLALLPFWPSHASSRRLKSAARQQLHDALRSFQPDLLWCEGPYPGVECRKASIALKLPYLYRSHNVEHLYMARQAKAARNWRDRFAWSLACVGLKSFETRMMKGAAWAFDISEDDLRFWKEEADVQRISWLPPIASVGVAKPEQSISTDSHEVVFLGNLTTPNNVRGVEWLLEEIAPLVLARRPGTQFLIAGSNPSEHVRQLCRARAEVTLLENPPDAAAIYRSGKVLVNPVRTGSGVQIKMIEMLMTDAPIVTATQGTLGMPAEVRKLFDVADTSEAFALAILNALTSPETNLNMRKTARRFFGVSGLNAALSVLEK